MVDNLLWAASLVQTMNKIACLDISKTYTNIVLQLKPLRSYNYFLQQIFKHSWVFEIKPLIYLFCFNQSVPICTTLCNESTCIIFDNLSI